MEPTQRRLRIGPIVGSIILLVLIGVIIAKWTTAGPTDITPDNPGVMSSDSSTPTPSYTPPAQVDFDHPSVELVWSFEEAYLISDPEKRNNALSRVATSAYIQANPIVKPRPEVSDVQSIVVRDKSPVPDWHSTPDPMVCYVITYPVIQTKRGQTTLNTYANGEPHVTKWIKNSQGWQADQESTIGLR